ncbi:hypothetical protein D0C36_22870 [Mucilaginibacter conchicola]|uniref:Uncharacterized protein n=2 Tax=Mucilaginibacter conchicola TaxID=2303333 RepID=A0A372NMZ1_9SPHI|nr:hypothetical protein D0C36_22870 [Mucilaginibacter conchicola]
MFKRLIESANTNLDITISERKNKLVPRMPYSSDGAKICPGLVEISKNFIFYY